MQENITSNLLSNPLLRDYIHTFFGYGSWSVGKFWFIGIEEAGGSNQENIEKRLNSWQDMGKTDLVDCKIHHKNIDSFITDPLLKMHSRTWTRLIKAKLGFQCIDRNSLTMLNVLNTDWGQLTSDNLLIELFPLPSPGVNYWNYPCWVDLKSDLYFLESRELYKAYIIAERINKIKQKIEEFKPQVVLFYGRSMQTYWDEIMGTDEIETINVLGNERYQIRHKKLNQTYFFQCPQPTYIRGYSFWTELGSQIRKLVNETP